MTFQMWSPFHFLFMASPFLFVTLFYFLFRRFNHQKIRLIGMCFSLIGIALLVGRNIEIYHKVNQISPEEIPLQICHFANFILFFAFLFESELLFSIAFCFNLPAALVSIIFANGLTNYQSLLTWQGMAYLWGHMLIVGIVLWAYFNNMIVINLKILRKTMSLIIILYILSIFVNNLFMKWMEPFTSNYFYTMAPEKGTPLEYFYKLGKETTTLGLHYNPIYLLMLLLVGLFVVFLFYLIYLFLNLVKNGEMKNLNEQNDLN
ncbi:TMEM164 family acyltransferase [Gottfriedia acidiceleris]|uniref:YwaF family protein n=1 Tax=Gottfriedia acidiceleris TaxID=371036 RepID=A0ABY4JRB3_9BACI|nr:YwaF family protein [Gottfriedia acidiceleris]UPM56339.1 YwaF family protein [Gottfriedia acidiceleris]